MKFNKARHNNNEINAITHGSVVRDEIELESPPVV